MHVSGRPVGSFDNEGLIFAAGVDAEVIRLYDLRSFDKVSNLPIFLCFHFNLFTCKEEILIARDQKRLCIQMIRFYGQWFFSPAIFILISKHAS